MIEYLLLGYAATILIFFGWTLKDATEYSFKIISAFILLSLAWPVILIIYYLDNKEA
jgi:hypothetical protein